MRVLSSVALSLAALQLVDGVRKIAKSQAESQTDASSLQRARQQVVQRNDRIVCPVLAAMWNAGDLRVDADGSMEVGDLYDGLHDKLGIRESLASFQSFGIVVFEKSQKEVEESRNKCVPPGMCFIRRRAAEQLGRPVPEDTLRWLNIFTNNGKQMTEHGISTGVRGGDTNMPPNAVNCRGVYPCVSRFDQFFGDVVSNGRFYLEDLMKVVCKARKFGDRGGEFAYAESQTLLGWDMSSPVAGREWQMRGAMSATLFAFGKRDRDNEWFLTMDDLRALFLDGRYPDGWQRREHGCVVGGCEWPGVVRWNLDVPCDVEYDEPFWQGTGCDVYTGKTCGIFSGCNSGETCVGRKCICDRGSNMRSMCFRSGACQEQQDDGYSYFGSSRDVVPGDNPTPRGNPDL